MLCIDYSSAFNTIVPSKLIIKVRDLGFNTALCSWILDFLMRRTQAVWMDTTTSYTLTLSTGAPQGCVLSPSCTSCSRTTAWPPSYNLLTTPVIGLIKRTRRQPTGGESPDIMVPGHNLNLNINKKRNLLWTTESCREENMLRFTSMRPKSRESAVLGSLG
ncbi:hypothetical protein N1851_028482 [Merluccius polli]|uniref:Reverse transcriptase domain-containing protein n=1 Tax=Merluccius polli TaxID=89951 RepID=A0AA47M8U8_MERPO|nr:hypothetical protein N1851_028482 [Merluccius polli]